MTVSVEYASRKAHLTHAVVVGLHALCCGLPILALAAVGLSGAAAGVVGFSDAASFVHEQAHGYELWMLLGSALLVSVGAALELAAWRAGARPGVPWLFAMSLLCFFVNAAIVLGHRPIEIPFAV